MKKCSLLAAAIAASLLTACASIPDVKPVHKFNEDTKVGNTTVTRSDKCHVANDVGAGAIGGLVLGPIGLIGGLMLGEWYSHKECK